MITLASDTHDRHASNKAHHPKGFAMSNTGYVQHLQRLDKFPDVKPLSYRQWIMLVIRIVRADTYKSFKL